MSHEAPYQGKTNIWLTPQSIIEALGPFDLDPCAAPIPRPWPTAKEHIVEDEDGLNREWNGFVWMNPPYGPHTGKWLTKLAEHGNGIALIFARTDTRYFQSCVKKSSLLFFPAKRIYFCFPDGTAPRGGGGAASVFIGFGELAKERLLNIKRQGFYCVQI